MMSQIDDLISEHCPGGVSYLSLEEIFEIRGGYTPSKSDPSNWDNGSIPWFRMEDIRGNGGVLDDSLQYATESAAKGGRLFAADSLIVATSATIGVHALVTVPFLANQRFTCLSRRGTFVDQLDPKFSYYYCFKLDEWCLGNTTTSSFSSVDMAGFKKFRFPLPPLEVQHEIVRVLDMFQSLEAELEAELEARRRQYTHYRDSLLDFTEGVRWMTLGEVGELVRGNGMPKSDFVDEGVGCIHYGQIYTRFGTSTSRTISFVPPEKAAKLAQVHPGDVIITNTSENLDDVCKAVAWLGDSTIVTGGHATVLKHQENSKYLAYYFQTHHFQVEKNRHATGTKVIDVSAKRLAKIRIPIPTLDRQKEIVAILDKFDALVNDLSVGLPAELAARRSQYEYYRDRLLTFEEAA